MLHELEYQLKWHKQKRGIKMVQKTTDAKEGSWLQAETVNRCSVYKDDAECPEDGWIWGIKKEIICIYPSHTNESFLGFAGRTTICPFFKTFKIIIFIKLYTFFSLNKI